MALTTSEGSRAFWQGRYQAAADAGERLWGDGPNTWIADHAKLLRPGSALDVGAGEGRNALWLAERGWRVTATDFAPAAVSTLLRTAAARDLRVTAVEADATAWVAAEPVDLVVLCYLQLEPPALAAAIRCAARSLRGGGMLLGIWHDRTDVQRGIGGTMDPAIRTTALETGAAARAAGLLVAQSGNRDRAVPGGTASDALLVARLPNTGTRAGITEL